MSRRPGYIEKCSTTSIASTIDNAKIKHESERNFLRGRSFFIFVSRTTSKTPEKNHEYRAVKGLTKRTDKERDMQKRS